MKAGLIAECLEPFTLVASKYALSPEFGVVEIGPKLIRACAPWGLLEADMEIGIDATIWADIAVFVSVMKSLPDQEVEFKVKSGVLAWQCGFSDGKLATREEIKLPALTKPKGLTLWPVTQNFLDGLELGGLSCGNKGMQSAGLYGVAIDNRDSLTVCSSDSATVSAYMVDADGIAAFPKMTVVDPEVIRLLVAIVDGNVHKEKSKPEEAAQLAITPDAIYCENKPFRMLCRPRAALKWDLREIINKYSAAETCAEIPQQAIAAFVKRATAMADSKTKTTVDLSAAEGALSLAFEEGVSSSVEYYIAQGLDIPETPPIPLDAARLARALSHVTEVVLDHIGDGAIVLRSDKFTYIISRREK